MSASWTKNYHSAGEGGRKSWYLTLNQNPNLLQKLGPVHGAPENGTTLLLFEDDVVALVRHLAASGLVMMTDSGRLVNGPALEWDDRKKR